MVLTSFIFIFNTINIIRREVIRPDVLSHQIKLINASKKIIKSIELVSLQTLPRTNKNVNK